MDRQVKDIEKSMMQSAVNASKVSTKWIIEEIRVHIEQELDIIWFQVIIYCLSELE